MNLIEQINEDLIKALKAHDETTSSTLRLLKSAIKNKEIALSKTFQDEEVQDIIAKEIKQRRDSITQFELGERKDLADKEQSELIILQGYQPTQLTESEITKLVDEAIVSSGTTSPRDMGKVMAALIPLTKGKADGSLVSRIVKEKLAV
ncbi:MAG: hypothetical protein ACD_58C00206G0008 [uncultured bacterium]|nr:MAG: hypothetical protein ACD_58C00206G0008 [uncultured bacterium]